MTTPKRAKRTTEPRYDFTYKRKGDALDARPLARRIKRAVDSYKASNNAALRGSVYDLERAIDALALVAGNQLSAELPLDIQYLSGMQRVSDWWGDQMIHNPVNCTISLTMTYLSRCVKRELESLESALASGFANAATEIENILSDPKADTLRYALRSLLIELSNESHVNVDTPGIAGTFYRVAALELQESDNIHVRQTFRHLAVLLSNPNAKTANALIKYWDDHRTKNLKVDPFPAKPDPFAVNGKNRSTLRDKPARKKPAKQAR